MKATITSVSIINGTITATYSTGTVKQYQADKAPGTVKAWIASHEPIPTDTEPAADPKPITAAATPSPSPADDLTRKTTGTTQATTGQASPTATAPETASPAVVAPRSMTASETIMLYMCLLCAAVWHVAASLAELAMIALYNLGWHVWSRRYEIKAEIMRICRWIRAAIIAKVALAAVRTAAESKATAIKAIKLAAILAFTARIQAYNR